MASALPQIERENGVVEVRFDGAGLSVGQTEIRRALGYGDARMDDHFERILDLVAARLPGLCDVKGGYVVRGATREKDRSGGLNVGERFFATDKIIALQLKKAEQAAFFVCTIGSGMETWSREMFREGDAVTGHFIDTAASVAVEAVAGMLHDHIGSVATKRGLHITNRFSPGYCGWPVTEQYRLFSFFPAGFCGITLTDSALMLPVKSVSGIIGIGTQVSREAYFCDQCRRTNCTYRAYRLAQQRKDGLA